MAWWGGALLALGVVAASIGAALFGIGTMGAALRTFTEPVRTAPADFTADLDTGTYVIYEQTGTRRDMGPFFNEQSRGVSITPADVLVLDPGGVEVPVEPMTVNETIDRNGEQFTGAVRFTVETEGVHRIEVSGGGERVVLAPSLVASAMGGLAWMAVAAAGGLVALVGLVLLVVGLVRAGRSSSAVSPMPAAQTVPSATPPATPVTAAGWYADPRGEARLRWWDGQTWTDHVS
jgi:hypothetical protein